MTTMSKINKLPINGILLIDKPIGLSSNAALQRVKHLFNAKKAGHTGSLDPLATGMLPICFGEATKVCQYLLDDDKSYIATGILGVKTTTGDSEGDIISEIVDFTIDETSLLSAIEQFIGVVHQIPSMYSALKHKGSPLYKLARQGISIERPAREILIHSIQLLNFDGKEFTIKVSCSKGTYIRNLVEDIGDLLGVSAHVSQLHRLFTAGFSDEKMYSLEELYAMDSSSLSSCLLPLERAIHYMPVINVDDAELSLLRQGKVVVNKSGVPGIVRIHGVSGAFLGLGDLELDGLLKVKRLLAFEQDKVA